MKIIWKFLTSTSDHKELSGHRAYTTRYEDLCM